MLTGPLGSFDAYVDAISRIPVLSREDEVSPWPRGCATTTTSTPHAQLVLSHLRFVVHIARGYGGYGLPVGDLVQEGNVGLMKAVRRFDPEVGVRLVSFAVHWIRAEIHEYVLRNWRLVKIATTKAQRKLFFNLRKYKRSLGWLSPRRDAGVARDLGVSRRRSHGDGAAARVARPVVRPGARCRRRGGDRTRRRRTCRRPIPIRPSRSSVRNGTTTRTSRSRMRSTSSTRGARRSCGRAGCREQKATLHELADQFGISAERVRQIEANAIKKLRKLVVAPDAA